MNNPKFIAWLKTQPKDFVDNVVNNKVLGCGRFDVEKLRELDSIFNPEDENDRDEPRDC